MVDFMCVRKSARWPIGLLTLAAMMFLATQVTSCADDVNPTVPPASKPGSPDSQKGVPQTARVEPGAKVAATTQEPTAPPVDEKHPLYIPLVEAYKSRDVMNNVQDYEAIFTKRELIGRKLMKSTMLLKIRHQPFSVYLKFQDPSAGREVIFVEGRNKDKQNRDQLYVHEVGIRSIVGTLSLPPNGADAMDGNRYPVNLIGMKNLVESIIKQWEAEGKLGEVTTQKYPNATLPSGEECVAYESKHPTPRNQFPYHITRLWIEKKTGLPIRVEQLGFPQKNDKTPPIIEEYTYNKVKTNISLGEIDFSIKNPNYGFR